MIPCHAKINRMALLQRTESRCHKCHGNDNTHTSEHFVLFRIFSDSLVSWHSWERKKYSDIFGGHINPKVPEVTRMVPNALQNNNCHTI